MSGESHTKKIPDARMRVGQRKSLMEGDTAMDRVLRKLRVTASLGLLGAVLGGFAGISPFSIGMMAIGSEELGLFFGLIIGALLAAFYKPN